MDSIITLDTTDFPKQEEAFDRVLEFKEIGTPGKPRQVNEYDVILYGGAIRGGKTFWGLGTLIIYCKMFPGSKWIVVRDSIETLKRNTLPLSLIHI